MNLLRRCLAMESSVNVIPALPRGAKMGPFRMCGKERDLAEFSALVRLQHRSLGETKSALKRSPQRRVATI